MQTLEEYDALIYKGMVFPRTAPRHLATMAALHGLKAAPTDTCRVLELGCGDGINLLCHAYAHPNSSFVGVDLAAAHIDEANAAAREIGASNTTFLHADVLQLKPEQIGKFDYIVAHGLYSWVPEPVRQHLLQIYSRCLNENGVGYISYNVYPGCRLREMLWDGMRYYTRSINEPADKVATARIFANVLFRSVDEKKEHKTLYERELKMLSERPDFGVAHDDLSPVSQPFYFHQFVEHINSQGLRFLCESDPRLSYTGAFNETANALLDTFREDETDYQQAIDFIRCGRFRASLICKQDAPSTREIEPSAVSAMYLCSDFSAACSEEDLSSDAEVEFKSQHDASITIRDPFLKRILSEAALAWPRKIKIGDALDKLLTDPKLANESSFESRIDDCRKAIITLFLSGAVQLVLDEISIGENVDDKPVCSAFARLQITRESATVCALDGHVFNAGDAVASGLIMLADGTRDRAALIAGLTDGIEVEDERRDEFNSSLPEMVESRLNELRLSGVIVPQSRI